VTKLRRSFRAFIFGGFDLGSEVVSLFLEKIYTSDQCAQKLQPTAALFVGQGASNEQHFVMTLRLLHSRETNQTSTIRAKISNSNGHYTIANIDFMWSGWFCFGNCTWLTRDIQLLANLTNFLGKHVPSQYLQTSKYKTPCATAQHSDWWQS